MNIIMKNLFVFNIVRKLSILLLLFVALSLGSCSKSDPEGPINKPDIEEQTDQFNQGKDQVVINHEFRGAWLTTVMGLDWPSTSQSPSNQQAALKKYIQNIKDLNCNVVIMQVCCNMEAYWNSSILPWAAQLTGVQGKDPGYDPLEIAISTAHSLGLELHAWINPLRCSGVSTSRAANHPYNIHPEWAQQYGNTYYWDPGNPEVADFLGEIVTELFTNYDIDGLHIDDFFYPDGLKDDPKTWDDSGLYALYGSGKSLTQWRESNINRVVKTLHSKTHEIKPNAIFGVSPAGRMELTKYLYADPEQWIAEGSVDYLAPQIYWPHSHSFAGFRKVLNSWQEVTYSSGLDKAVPIIPGLAAYRLGESGFENMSEFYDQVADTREVKYGRGNIWFRSAHISAGTFYNYMKKNIYPYSSLIPKLSPGILSATPTINAPYISLNNKQIQWDKIDGANRYAVYELSKEKTSASGKVTWRANLVTSGDFTTYRGKSGKNYVVIAINGKDYSQTSNVVYIN